MSQIVVGTRFAGRYDIRTHLGDGVHGYVWEAHDSNVRRDVALKQLLAGVDAVTAYAEAAYLHLLSGDYILPVYDATTYGDVPYLTTAIAPLGSTEHRLDETVAGISPDVAVRWVRQALVGLGSAHVRRLVHRDVKPGNIFLKAIDHAALGDFSLAREIDHLGQVPVGGDPLVRPPEMFRGRPGDFRSDVYSMGVTLYRLLTKRWPFEDPDWPTLRALVVSGRCLPVMDLAPHIPPLLGRIIEKAMGVDPAQRFQDWHDMDRALAKVTFNRDWTRVLPHPGHDRCWAETPKPNRATHEVCVIPDGRKFHIDVRLETRRGRLHDRRRSSPDIRRPDLARRLRKTFRSV